MQFWQYRTTRACMKSIRPERWSSISQFYADSLDFSARELHDVAAARQQVLEGTWELRKCPYYRVYPTIIPMLLRLNLSLDASLIKLPLCQTFAIYFPKVEHPLSFDASGEHFLVRSLLCGPATLLAMQQACNGISIWVDFGETAGACYGIDKPAVRDFPILTYVNMPIKEGISVEEASKMLPDDPSATYGITLPRSVRTGVIKLVCTLCLLENDPAIIEPDVLDKDRATYERSPVQKIIDRAHHRGKIGWNVGRKIEIMPHVRGPSPLALYWTGKGRTVPLIRYRKGCIVHRELVGKISTTEDYDEQQLKTD